jgi:hypothetical protein
MAGFSIGIFIPEASVYLGWEKAERLRVQGY